MDIRSWIKRLWSGETIETTTTQSKTNVPISASRRDSTETDSSSYEPRPEAPTLLALSVPSAFASSSARGPDAAIPDIWHIGDVLLDQYEVMGILGEGGMGTVYRVHHRGWNTDLAVKSPKAGIFARAGGKENFIREAETWVKLPLHPNIVSCYYVRTLGDIPRVFAEYVEGGSLSGWIRQCYLYQGGHKQALERMLDAAIQFAWGLHFAHEQGLIHQDVKPANVMITSKGTVKVADFGLAKARAMAGEGEIPSPNAGESIVVSWGGMTPAYCSPEQASKGTLSRKTDIWSWAVSILEMFIGDITWRTGAEARKALDNYEERDTVIPIMPPEVMKLLNQCFQFLPENRPATMQEVAVELQVIYAHLLGPYPREVPRAVGTVADSLNNRALSLLDLGRRQEAQHAWEQALSIDPYHPETTYNWGLVRWHEGTLTDDALVQQLEGVRGVQREPWQASYLLAQVQLERGDGEAAQALLEKILQQAPDQTEVQRLLAHLQAGAIPVNRCLHTFRESIYIGPIALSANGQQLLAGVGKAVRIWEVGSGRCLHVLEGHADQVSVVSLSVDGRLALSGSQDKTLRVWEVSSGRCLHVLEGHADQVTSVGLSTDGRLAISGSSDLTIHVWEVTNGRRLRTFTLPVQGLIAPMNKLEWVGLSADGQLAFTKRSVAQEFTYDYEVWVWDVVSGRRLHTFTNTTGRSGWPMSVSRDGWLALLSEGSSLAVRDLASGHDLRTLKGHTDQMTSVSLSANGQLALSGSLDKTLRVWEVSSGRCLHVLGGHTDRVTSVSLSTDGRLAISSSSDQTLRVWEVSSGRCLHTLEGHTDVVATVGLSADGRVAISRGGWRDETVRLWEVSSGRCLHVFPAQWVEPVCLSADGLLAIAGSYDGTVRLWDLTSGRCLHTLEGHTGTVTAVSLSARRELAISGSADRTARIWDLTSGRCLQTLEEIAIPLWASLSADGQLALLGNADGRRRVWEVDSGRCLHTLEERTDKMSAVSLSADGRLAVSGSRDLWDKTAYIWDLASGNCVHKLEGHTSEVNAVSLSADGRLAISGSQDKTLRVWEIASGRCLHTLEGHTGSVDTVSLSADGRLAVSGSYDQTVRVWEVSSGRCLHTLEGHNGSVASVSLSADGKRVLSGSSDKTLRVWEIASGRCLLTLKALLNREIKVSLSADDQRVLLESSGRISGIDQAIASVWEIPQESWLCPLTPTQVRSSTEIARVEQQAFSLLQQAEQALKEARITEALEQVRAMRDLEGWGRAPQSLEAWIRLGRLCRKTNLRAMWLIETLIGHKQNINSMSLSADGQLALSGSWDATVRVWEIASGRCLHTLEGHTEAVTVVCLSANGKLALSGSRDTTVRVWEIASGRCLHTLEGHTGGVTAVSLSADGRWALSSDPSSIRLWDVTTGRCLRVIEGEQWMGITAANLSADGREIIAGYANNRISPQIMPKHGPVERWETASGRRLSTFGELVHEVTTMSLSSDGKLVIYGCELTAAVEAGLWLWEVSSGRCLGTLNSGRDWAQSMSLSADGRFALSGNVGEITRLWDVTSQRCLHTLISDGASSVSLSADGQFALLGIGGLVQVWMLDWELDASTPAVWDERANRLLEAFLTLHTPFAALLPQNREPTEEERRLALTRRGQPMWTEEDFEGFIRQLQYCGHGQLQPEEVRRRLEQIASAWWEPPPLLGA